MTNASASGAAASASIGFAHLHLHSEYSLLDGGNVIDKLVARVKELGMGAVALTDHGNLFGAIEFYSACKGAGIKPILGIEAYVAPTGDRTERKTTGLADGGFHLVLLAENLAGWRNLLKLSSDSFLTGFYYKPRMDRTTLTQWNEGLIAINGHLGSSIAHHLLMHVQTGSDAHYQAAIEEARWHASVFAPNENGQPRFFIELQRHDTPEQEQINPHLIRLARELSLPLVCDNDAHFLLAQDWDFHDTLCCISMAKNKAEENRNRYSKQLYVKSPQQMAELFPQTPEAVANTVAIADRCSVDLDFSKNHAPVVRVEKTPRQITAPTGSTEWYKEFCSQYALLPFDEHRDKSVTAAQLKADCDRALRELAEAGLIWRYGEPGITDAIRKRLDWELKVLADKLISAYFLIVWDFVNWARQQGIPAMARGSGVGTMVGYVLGLSNACPEKYGLLFERFTDPDRSEYPDIDVDICQDGRAAVLDYVRQKYGHVAQIITFGRLKAKAAIKDVARVMGLSPAEGQRLSNLVPHELNITIDEALSKEPDLKAEYAREPIVKQIVDAARALEDHARHAGVHAAGVVIATQPLDNIVPLCKTPGNDDVVTQWDGPTCEKVGLLKMDFLGLRTLSIIERARQLITQTLPEEAVWKAVGRASHFSGPGFYQGPHPLDLDRLSYDDQRVFDLFRRGDMAGIFQFESDGMRRLLMDMQPDRLEDLIAANALFRPGPMELIPDYCQRKHRRQQVPKIHPIVDQYTAETYGIMVYQEQVMQIVHGLGGIPLRSAYSLIKAISKKKSSVIDAERPKFIEGAAEKGLSRGQAQELFDLILKFAGYGFNKSHSTGYAIVAYQTAYLKTYFPNQYMAALLTFESAAQKVDDWVALLEDCRRTMFPDHSPERPHVGVQVLPPDINLSEADFSVVFVGDEPRESTRGHVRFGLGAIKGIGSGAIQGVIAERRKNGPYRSIFDLCERADLRAVNKAAIEALIRCGAFDSVHGTAGRAAAMSIVADAVTSGQRAAQDRLSGQLSMFGGAPEPAEAGPGAGTTNGAATARALPNVPAWDRMTALANERETLGFHVSGHPLDQYESLLSELGGVSISRLATMPAEAVVRVCGVVTRVKHSFVKNGPSAGQRMAWVTLQDKTGSIDAVLFSSAFAEHGKHLRDHAVIVVIGRADRGRAEPGVIVDQIIPIDDAARELAAQVELSFDDSHGEQATAQLMEMAAGVLSRSVAAGGGGRSAEVSLNVTTRGRCVSLKSRTLRAVPSVSLVQELRDLLGAGAVRLIPSTHDTLKTPPRKQWGNGKKQTADA